MKSTTFAVLASATLAMAKPLLLNSAGDFEDLEAGAEFPLKYSGCDSGCTITLETGPSTALKPVTTLAADASGDSITVTLPEDLVSGNYAFRIVDNSDNNPETNQNFSKQFPVEGSAETTSSAASSSAASTSRAASSSAASSAASSESEVSSSAAETSSATETSSAVETSSVTVTSLSTLTTPAPTKSESSTSTQSSTSTTSTTIPDSAAAGYQAQLGLVMAAAVAIAAL
jgi:hypothetical protein